MENRTGDDRWYEIEQRRRHFNRKCDDLEYEMLKDRRKHSNENLLLPFYNCHYERDYYDMVKVVINRYNELEARIDSTKDKIDQHIIKYCVK